jgi:hypothetical protein
VLAGKHCQQANHSLPVKYVVKMWLSFRKEVIFREGFYFIRVIF